MRKAIAILAGLAVLAFVNYGIWARERLLTEGRIVLLDLQPVDPRSLLQGDYMRLDFALASQAFPWDRPSAVADGKVIAALNPHGVAAFRRLDKGEPLAPGEVALRYRIRGGRPNFGTNAFFFEEGQAQAYANARYGEFRVDSDGEMILTGLRDDKYRPLGVKR